MNPLNTDYIDKIKIKPNSVILYQEYVGNRIRIPHADSLKNLEHNKHSGYMSIKAIKRLYNAMDWFLIIAKNKQAENLKTGAYFNYKLSMLTLTLPATQFHSDLYIKKKLLNEFFTILRKKYNLENYIWKAEKQINGNIHFHIVLDRYIYYKKVNNIWNKILNTHGYIDKYRINQQKTHEKGFYYKKSVADRWGKSAQIRAYKFGTITNWKSPSGTTDIHSLKKIKSARAYLSKYLTKNPDTSKLESIEINKYCNKIGTQEITSEEIDKIRKEVREKLKVNGNLWYISQSLSKLKGAICELTEVLKEDLETIRKKFKDKIEDLEFCRLYKINIYEIVKYGLKNLLAIFQKYILEIRNQFYPPGTTEFYTLGIPLPIFDQA